MLSRFETPNNVSTIIKGKRQTRGERPCHIGNQNWGQSTTLTQEKQIKPRKHSGTWKNFIERCIWSYLWGVFQENSDLLCTYLMGTSKCMLKRYRIKRAGDQSPTWLNPSVFLISLISSWNILDTVDVNITIC